MTDSISHALWAEAAYQRPAANSWAIWMEVAHSVETTDPPVPRIMPIMTVTLAVLDPEEP
jgi:hypothetical protein